MKVKKIFILFLGILIIGSTTGCSLSKKTSSEKSEEKLAKTKVNDDFYTNINYEWLKKNTIPKDQDSTDEFSRIANGIDEKLRTKLKHLLSNNPKEDSEVSEMVKYYKKSLDFKEIDKLSDTPIKPYLAEIEKINSKENYVEFVKNAIINQSPHQLPFSFEIEKDLKDSNKKIVSLYYTDTILPDKVYYDKNNEDGQIILKEYKKAAIKLLKKYGLNQEEAERKLKNTLTLDSRMAKHCLPAEEKQDMQANYNIVSRKEFYDKGLLENAFPHISEEILGREINEFNVSEQDIFNNSSSIFDLNNLDEIKDWSFVRTLFNEAIYLSNDYRKIIVDYQNKINGTESSKNEREISAYDTTNSIFGPVMGKIYSEEFFSKESKEKVEEMTIKLIGRYKNRIENSSWLSDNTKKEALKKLDNMVIKIGYPETLDEVYEKIKVDEEKNIIDINKDISKEMFDLDVQNIDKPENRTNWNLSANDVNATYDPTNNDITIPAGILQAPLFDSKQTDSENYGGIGVVIGHEISHAFDTNGSHFNEKGNMTDWWNKKDYEEFEKRTKAVIDSFDGLEYMGNKVNGNLTVSENIADLGGLSVSLEQIKTENGYNLKEYFENYAKIWRSKVRPEFAQIITSTDPHAPNIWRVNAQLPNFDDFYKTYGIKEGDKMWKSPNKRLSIW